MNTSIAPVSFLGRLARLPFLAKVVLMSAVMLTAPVPFATTARAQSNSDNATMSVESDDATQHFGTLQSKMKNFAIVVLLIMLVVAAIMAAMQKTGMAISIAIAAIILFGGIWILKLLQSGLTTG